MKYELPVYEISIDEAMHLGVDEIAFVEDPAIQELWVAMNEEIKLAAEDDKMIVTGPALVPDRLIYRIHPKTGAEYYIKFSKEAIAKIVLRYFTQNKVLNFNLEHDKENDVQGVIMESWIVKDPTYDQSVLYGFKNLIPGTWMVAVKVEDKQFWDEYVKTGKVRGFSIEGAFAQQLAEELSKQEELVIDPKSGETQDEFVSRCIAFEVGNGYDVDQATAMCYSKWDEGLALELKEYSLTPEEAQILIKEVLLQESYNDYPQGASDAAKRALKYKEENPNISCGTRVGWARANQLANRRPISEETIARMASFARHLQYEDVSYEEGCGGLMVDAWGGRVGIQWAKRKLEQIRRQAGR